MHDAEEHEKASGSPPPISNGGDNTDDQVKAKMARFAAAVKSLESETSEIEARLELLKVKVRQESMENESELGALEDAVKEQRRVTILLKRRLLAHRLEIEGYPSEELLELLKSGRKC
ncbi:unnamed protein product [Rhizoctonia solani]|uniref:Uncharacterized protein n=1 Tax=Rhizoctonia solani TaxID=456999 RepID=A0A8H3DGH2_9AGAM|nr:unnamed protein product [Rhizoctonia solani]